MPHHKVQKPVLNFYPQNRYKMLVLATYSHFASNDIVKAREDEEDYALNDAEENFDPEANEDEPLDDAEESLEEEGEC